MPTSEPGSLDAGLDRVWRLLAGAVDDRAAPFRQPVVATGGDAGPDARMMVLRGVDRAADALRFYTDVRAGKITTIAAAPRVAVLGWDESLQLQVRMHGQASVATGGAAVDAAWTGIGDTGRRAYLTTLAPGTCARTARSGIDPGADPARARTNFAILTVAIDRIETLELLPAGHRRAVYGNGAAGWSGTWLIP